MGVTFRAGVGGVIVDQRGRVLAFQRSAIPGAWQLPQGGIEDDEEPIDALWRELREETGLTDDNVELVGEVPEWLGYLLPVGDQSEKTGRGQVHKWFVLRARNERLPVRFDTTMEVEFSAWRWLTFPELIENAVSFRRAVYRRLADVVAEFDA